MAHREYDLKDRLQPLWGRVGGRDELARLTGISGSTLSAYNTGRQHPRLANVQRIADALGVDVLDLVGEPEPSDMALLTQIVTRLEEDPTQAAGELSPLLLRLADELHQLSFRLRQAVARQGERWRNG